MRWPFSLFQRTSPPPPPEPVLPTPTFAELRELLQTPSSSTWQSLITLLLRWPEDEQALAAEYAERHLEHWPEEVRLCSTVEVPVEVLALCRHLHISSSLEIPGVRAFLNSEQGTKLTLLDLTGSRVDELQAQSFARIRHPLAIHTLKLGYTLFNNQALMRWIRSGHLPELRHLDLEELRIPGTLFQRMMLEGLLQGLETLGLKANHIQGEGVSILERLQQPVSWVSVDLSHNQIGGQGVLSLCESTYLPALRHLSLSGNSINRGAVDALVQSPLPHQLESLQLAGCIRSERAMLELVQDWPESPMELLELSDCAWTEESLEALVEAPWCSEVKKIKLGALPLEKLSQELVDRMDRTFNLDFDEL